MTNREKAVEYITTMTESEARRIVAFMEQFNFDVDAAIKALRSRKETA